MKKLNINRISGSKISITFCMVLLISQQSHALGRLFMSPDRRIKIDQNFIEPVSKAEVIQTPQNNLLKLNGFVKPKHGASTIWINGIDRKKISHRKANIRHWVSPQNQISVDLQTKRVQLRPGQILDIENRLIQDSYHRTAAQEPDSLDADFLSEESETTENLEDSAMINAKAINKIITQIPVLDINQ